MSQFLSSCGALMLMCAALGLPACESASKSSGAALGDSSEALAWMSGVWRTGTDDRYTEEVWMEPVGGSMVGVSRTVRGDTMVFFEHVRVETKDGKPCYIASPKGQSTATFCATHVGHRSVTFENLDHDFPQRIIYTQESPDRMLAAIEGLQNGQTRREEWHYERAARIVR